MALCRTPSNSSLTTATASAHNADALGPHRGSHPARSPSLAERLLSESPPITCITRVRRRRPPGEGEGISFAVIPGGQTRDPASTARQRWCHVSHRVQSGGWCSVATSCCVRRTRSVRVSELGRAGRTSSGSAR